MERGGFVGTLVLAVTLLGAAYAARADAPGPDFPAPATHARAKKQAPKPVASKMSDRCKTDDDCALTAFNDGACCPTLCQERAVSKTSADAIQKYAAVCKKPGTGCPELACAPPAMARQAACVNRKCVVRAESPRTRE